MDFRLVTVALLGAYACRRSDSSPPPAIAYRAHLNAGGVVPAGGILINPLKGDKQAAADGETFFSTMNCDGCHGGGATGWVGPSLVARRWRYGGADGEIYASIFYGRPRGMPAYGGILTRDVIWRLVSYIQAQPVPKDVPTESWVEATESKSGRDR
jgi:cytochrome c oxidase cbb3-type subunit 3